MADNHKEGWKPAPVTYERAGHHPRGVAWRVWEGEWAHAEITGPLGRIHWLSKRFDHPRQAHAALAIELKRRFGELPPPPKGIPHRRPPDFTPPRVARPAEPEKLTEYEYGAS